MRRTGEHGKSSYRLWVEPLPGGYRGWFRAKIDTDIGQASLVDQASASTPELYESPDEALDAAEAMAVTAIEKATSDAAEA